MSKVIDLDEHRPAWTVAALCLSCMHKWIGTILARTSIFQLHCPACGDCDSFASFYPVDYLEEVNKAFPEEPPPKGAA